MKRFGLSPDERIKSRKDFEIIYSVGRSLFSFDKKIKSFYVVEKQSENPGVMIAVAVGKKIGSAVWRNRFKRVIKDSYRLNKIYLVDSCLKKKYLIKIVFSPQSLSEKSNKKIYSREILPCVVDILYKLKSSLEWEKFLYFSSKFIKN